MSIFWDKIFSSQYKIDLMLLRGFDNPHKMSYFTLYMNPGLITTNKMLINKWMNCSEKCKKLYWRYH